MEEQKAVNTSVVFALLALAFLGTLLFVGWSSFLVFLDSGDITVLPFSKVSLEETLLSWLLYATGALVVAVTLIIYLSIAARERAQHIANRMLRDALASQQMLLQLFQESPIPYLLISYEGKIQMPNKAALRLFDTVAEELEDKKIYSFFPKENHEHIDILLSRFQSNVASHEEELFIEREDGTRRYVILSIFPVQSKESKRNGLMSLVDITEREEVERAKTEFVSLASHQLRTPLSAIKWYTELLISGDFGELQPRQVKYVEKVHESNERMIELVNTLLNVSRLELGTFMVDRKPVVIIDVAENILEELKGKINAKKIIIGRQYSQLPTMNTDPKLLRMILQNLLSNAVKYTPEGGRVNLALQLQGSKLEIVVTDTGMGIPKKEHDLIFTKLYRAENARELISDGNGLGLYIVKAVMEVLEGSVSFVSEEGRGTTFTATLPF